MIPRYPNDSTLRKLFVEYNAKFFASRLSAYRVAWGRPGSSGADGWCDRRVRRITVAHNTADLPGTLLHEMAHAVAGDRHGKLFHKEIERLMRAHAPVQPHLTHKAGWLGELPLCRRWAQENGVPSRMLGAKVVYSEFRDAARGGVLTFAAATRQVAYKLGTTPTAIFARCDRRRAYAAYTDGHTDKSASRIYSTTRHRVLTADAKPEKTVE